MIDRMKRFGWTHNPVVNPVEKKLREASCGFVEKNIVTIQPSSSQQDG